MEKNEKGYIKNPEDFKTKLHNGYDLVATPVKVDEDGSVIEEIEYWANEEGYKSVHEAFARYIKDFGIPNKHVIIVDKESEYMAVHRVYVFFEPEIPTVEIEFT